MQNTAPAIAPVTRGLPVPQINNATVSRLRSSEWWLYTGQRCGINCSLYRRDKYSKFLRNVGIYVYLTTIQKENTFLKYVTLLNEVINCWYWTSAMIGGYGVLVEWYWQGKTEGLRKENPGHSVPIRPPQITDGLTWNGTWASVVRALLTALLIPPW